MTLVDRIASLTELSHTGAESLIIEFVNAGGSLVDIMNIDESGLVKFMATYNMLYRALSGGEKLCHWQKK